MIPTRAALAIPAAVLVLSGCGAVSTVQLRASGAGIAYADATHASAAAGIVTPAPIPPVRRSRFHEPRRDGSSRQGATEWLEIVSGSGTVVAKTTIDPTVALADGRRRRRRLLDAGRRGA